MKPVSEMLILVDDDELFRSALAANLREDGYEVLEYASGRAIALDRLSGVEALLTDYHMADEDGLHLADRFHAAMPRVPIVIMSAFAPAYLESAVADRRYATLLPKPLDYEELRAVLENAITAAFSAPAAPAAGRSPRASGAT